jgi:hypothetical protein
MRRSRRRRSTPVGSTPSISPSSSRNSRAVTDRPEPISVRSKERSCTARRRPLVAGASTAPAAPRGSRTWPIRPAQVHLPALRAATVIRPTSLPRRSPSAKAIVTAQHSDHSGQVDAHVWKTRATLPRCRTAKSGASTIPRHPAVPTPVEPDGRPRPRHARQRPRPAFRPSVPTRRPQEGGALSSPWTPRRGRPR